MARAVVIFVLVISPFLVLAQDFNAIKTKLENMHLESLQLRRQVMPTIRKFGESSPEMDTLNQQIIVSDQKALAYVLKVVEIHGWLGSSQIGETANHTLFTTIQHAQDSKYRLRLYPLLTASAATGESSPADAATMLDRILIEQGKKQVYGTQSHMINGEMKLHPTIDIISLNKRRKKVGLEKIKNPIH